MLVTHSLLKQSGTERDFAASAQRAAKSCGGTLKAGTREFLQASFGVPLVGTVPPVATRRGNARATILPLSADSRNPVTCTGPYTWLRVAFAGLYSRART